MRTSRRENEMQNEQRQDQRGDDEHVQDVQASDDVIAGEAEVGEQLQVLEREGRRLAFGNSGPSDCADLPYRPGDF
jgi:hypothetical protein